jgi:hypothetical protein
MENFNLPVKKDYQAELANSRQLCDLLMKTPHYAKLGAEGIFAVVETAKSLGVDPRQALGGGLYYVKGKVEMSSRMMNAVIRAQKHSIMRDQKSDDTICILHGKRADNGDTWTESFSIQDAQRAGLMGNAVWKNYPKDMLFARALSRLARQLFPDIIGNCYVEGEIAMTNEIQEAPAMESVPMEEVEFISAEQIEILNPLLKKLDEESLSCFFEWIKRVFNASSVPEIPKANFDKCVHSLNTKIKYINDKNKQQVEAVA